MTNGRNLKIKTATKTKTDIATVALVGIMLATTTILLGTFSGLASIAIVTTIRTSNLVDNPSFEGSLGSWTYFQGYYDNDPLKKPPVPTVSNAQHHGTSGSYSARIEATYGTNSITQYLREIDLSKNYKFSAWFYVENTWSSHFPYMYIREWYTDGTMKDFKDNNNLGGGNWWLSTIYYTPSKDKTIKDISISFRVDNNGYKTVFYVDDVDFSVYVPPQYKAFLLQGSQFSLNFDGSGLGAPLFPAEFTLSTTTLALVPGHNSQGALFNPEAFLVYNFPSFPRDKGAIELWFKPASAFLDGQQHILFSNSQSGGNYEGFTLLMGPGKGLHGVVKTSSKKYIAAIGQENSAKIVAGQWYKVLFTWSLATNKGLMIYLYDKDGNFLYSNSYIDAYDSANTYLRSGGASVIDGPSPAFNPKIYIGNEMNKKKAAAATLDDIKIYPSQDTCINAAYNVAPICTNIKCIRADNCDLYPTYYYNNKYIPFDITKECNWTNSDAAPGCSHYDTQFGLGYCKGFREYQESNLQKASAWFVNVSKGQFINDAWAEFGSGSSSLTPTTNRFNTDFKNSAGFNLVTFDCNGTPCRAYEGIKGKYRILTWLTQYSGQTQIRLLECYDGKIDGPCSNNELLRRLFVEEYWPLRTVVVPLDPSVATSTSTSTPQ